MLIQSRNGIAMNKWPFHFRNQFTDEYKCDQIWLSEKWVHTCTPVYRPWHTLTPSQLRHIERDGVSNHQRLDCFSTVFSGASMLYAFSYLIHSICRQMPSFGGILLQRNVHCSEYLREPWWFLYAVYIGSVSYFSQMFWSSSVENSTISLLKEKISAKIIEWTLLGVEWKTDMLPSIFWVVNWLQADIVRDVPFNGPLTRYATLWIAHAPRMLETFSPPYHPTSTVYWCSAWKLKAHIFFIEWAICFNGWVYFFQYMCHHVVPKRLSQLDYELNDLKISSAS